jgi:membrane protein
MKPEKLSFFTLLVRAFKEFRKNDPLRLAGATAFFTTFALPAVLLILIQVFGLVLTPRFMTRQLVHNLGDVVGTNTAGELHKTLFNVRHLFKNGYKAALGFLFLIFVATTLLKVIKDSLNQLWNIRTLDRQGFRFSLIGRAKSFLVILVAGILFMMVLLAEGGVDLIQKNADNPFLRQVIQANEWIRQVVSLILVTIWFSVIFKYLPDGRPDWKTVLVGSAFTGILFSLGKILLQWVLTYQSMESIYGTSTSSVLLLLFVFYSSFIFYFGACFTRIWGESHHKPIEPTKHAEKYQWAEIG